MEVLVVAATGREIGPLQAFLEEEFIKVRDFQYQKGSLSVSLLITGVGLTLTAYALGRVLATHRYQLLVNAGLAGAFNRSLHLGEVVQVTSEVFADLGAETAEEGFINVHELGLLPADQPPFRAGVLHNETAAAFNFLPKVTGLSVNTVHGSSRSIDACRQRIQADVESMEGAAFFYVALQESIPFLQIRAISNYVEPRQRENWDIPLAIRQLNDVLIKLIGMLA